MISNCHRARCLRQSILSYVRRAAEKNFSIVINLSSQPWTGGSPPPGEYQDVTPRPDTASAPLVTLPALQLGAWEFRIFQRRGSQLPCKMRE